jgi:hypothetical protein
MEQTICRAFRSKLVHANSNDAMLGGASGLNQDSQPREGGSV